MNQTPNPSLIRGQNGFLSWFSFLWHLKGKYILQEKRKSKEDGVRSMWTIHNFRWVRFIPAGPIDRGRRAFIPKRSARWCAFYPNYAH